MKGIIIGYIALILVAAIGWVMNIVQIAHSDFGNITGMLVVKCIGVFIVPVGAILGYIG